MPFRNKNHQETTTIYTSIERLLTVEFGKKVNCFGHLCVERKDSGKGKTTDCHSAELIGYETQAVMFKNYSVLISKHQSLNQCQGFPVFSYWLFFYIASNNLPTLLRSRLSQEKYLFGNPGLTNVPAKIRANLPTLHALFIH